MAFKLGKDKEVTRVGSLLGTLEDYNPDNRPKHATGEDFSVKEEANSRFINLAVDELMPAGSNNIIEDKGARDRYDAKSELRRRRLDGETLSQQAGGLDTMLNPKSPTKKSGFKLSGMTFHDY